MQFISNYAWKFVILSVLLQAKLLSLFEICKKKEKN